MNILIVGGGGREHALAWQSMLSPSAKQVFVAPGNAGTDNERRVNNVAIDADDTAALLDFARNNAIDLVIPGPEGPLVSGIVDQFRKHGIDCFGPDQAAARLEGSKNFAKEFCRRHNIPTPDWHTFTGLQGAILHIQQAPLPLVIKADGLAAGKGVVITSDREEAIATVEEMLSGRRHGRAGQRVLMEEFMRGEEASFMVMSDGVNILPLASSCDYKRRDDGGRGPNTGGMGVCSPAPAINPDMHERITNDILQPAVHGMHQDGCPYKGFLYAGLMIREDGSPTLLEFNCRLGDPEAQAVLLRLRSDLPALCRTALHDKLDGCRLNWDRRVAVGVVLAAAGYPGEVRKGTPIRGLNRAEAIKSMRIFHAGTRKANGHIVTAGGRVLCVTALGGDIAQARTAAYQAAADIKWDGMFYRKDIARF